MNIHDPLTSIPSLCPPLQVNKPGPNVSPQPTFFPRLHRQPTKPCRSLCDLWYRQILRRFRTATQHEHSRSTVQRKGCEGRRSLMPIQVMHHARGSAGRMGAMCSLRHCLMWPFWARVWRLGKLRRADDQECKRSP